MTPPPVTPPPLPTVRRCPPSLIVALVMIGISVVWSLISSVVEQSGRGTNLCSVFLAFVLGVALWQGTRVGWVISLVFGVLWVLLAGVAFLVVDSGVGVISAVVGLVTGAVLVVMLLLPASREYCWGRKPL